MMKEGKLLQVSQVKLPIGYTAEDVRKACIRKLKINEKIILQMKSNQNINKFYLVELKEKNNTQQMTLTKIKLNINDIIPTGDEPVIFERDI